MTDGPVLSLLSQPTRDLSVEDVRELQWQVAAPFLEGALKLGWTARQFNIWVQMSPVKKRRPTPRQGWKLHLSATTRNADDVLAAALPFLLDRHVGFKFVRAPNMLETLNSARSHRGGSGKFVTIYPAAEDVVEISDGLASILAEFEGPAILSDRRVQPGSIVHYRYGSFVGERVFTVDGMLIHVLRDPNDEAHEDRREAWFVLPDWVTDPFDKAKTQAIKPDKLAERTDGTTPRPVVLDGRYIVTTAIRHSNRGGVYFATELATGREVVVKEARPFTGTVSGLAPDEAIRHEFRMLQLLQPAITCPEPLELFEQQGHLFLVESKLDGESLEQRVYEAGGIVAASLPIVKQLEIIDKLVELTDQCHSLGVILEDLKPSNIMINHDDDLALVDPETAIYLADRDPRHIRGGTQEFSSPEHMSGAFPTPADDVYSMGATIFMVATGRAPSPAWNSVSRSIDYVGATARNRSILEGCVRSGMSTGWIARLVLDLMTPPCDRPTLRVVRERLRQSDGLALDRSLLASTHRFGDSRQGVGSDVAARCRSLARDILAWLLREGDGEVPGSWPQSVAGEGYDDLCVQTGLSGVGLAYLALGRAGLMECLDPVERLADRVDAAIGDGRARPPGLYFGVAGSAVFLAEAGAVLGRDDLVRRSRSLLHAVTADRLAHVDICHGVAGVGIAHLATAAVDADTPFEPVLAGYASMLCDGADLSSGHPRWVCSTDPRSIFAEKAFWGFAHGSAGIAYFLLLAGSVCEEERFTAMGLSAMHDLVKHRIEVDAAAFWPSRADQGFEEKFDRRAADWVHWCNGSAGVGTALVRAAAISGDRLFSDAAAMAASAVETRERFASPVQCHGLAGHGELLLDLAAIGQTRSAQLASLVGAIERQLVDVGGGLAIPCDERGGRNVHAGYNTGAAGVATFLARVADDGPRLLMPDHVLAGWDRPSVPS